MGEQTCEGAQDRDVGRLDRVAGVILGTAVGDALGAGYEFESAQLGPDGPRMIGGGLLGARWGAGAVPGEWRRINHGYPGIGSRELERLATDAASLQEGTTM